ncbi:MAG TPA: energy transducer TonB [Terriglobia bacterium]|nr:energy transducer TonB [Terriglobia bacterium]
MSRAVKIFVLALVELAAWLCFLGIARGDAKQDLQTAYVGKQYVLRNFYSGDHLKYDSQGNLTGGGEPGMWALDGIVRIEKFKLESETLQFAGQRLIVGWDPTHGQLYKLGGEPVTIDIELGSGGLLPDGLQAALARVFYPFSTDASQLMPTYWQRFIELPQAKRDPFQVATASDGEPIYVITAERPTMPARWQDFEPIRTPDPPYSDRARSRRTQGAMGAAILIDRHGRVADVILTGKPLGDGLDQNAAATLRNWTFKPATKDGAAQNVIVHVDLSFRVS